MKNLYSEDFKHSFCEILGDVAKKDWAGEPDDHFTASLHLDKNRVAGALLLNGPALFREMTSDLLEKRATQTCRLASTPADVLIVQHCHHIVEAVRATPRAFAVLPHNPRRYCLIKGKDTYLILKTYGKL